MMAVMLSLAVEHAVKIGKVESFFKEEIVPESGTKLNLREFEFEMALGFPKN